jgi:tetratricopeptide (TPR) repeat protein
MRKPSKIQKKSLAKSSKIGGSKRPPSKKISKPAKKKGLTTKPRTKTSVRKAKSLGNLLPGKKTSAQQSNKTRNIKRLQEELIRRGSQSSSNRYGRISPSRTASLKQYETAVKLLYAQEFDKAKALFEKIIHTFEEDKELVERTRIHIRLCEQKSARKPPSPRSVDEHYDLAISFYNQGKYEQAFEHLQKALKYDPSCDYVHYALAAIYCKTGDLETALLDLREAINLKPENRFLAQRDEDFAPLKEDSRFITMVFPDRSGSVTP